MPDRSSERGACLRARLPAPHPTPEPLLWLGAPAPQVPRSGPGQAQARPGRSPRRRPGRPHRYRTSRSRPGRSSVKLPTLSSARAGSRPTRPRARVFRRLRSESAFHVDICRSTRSTASNSAAASASVPVRSGAKNTAEYRVPMVGPFNARRTSGAAVLDRIARSVDIFNVPPFGFQRLQVKAHRSDDRFQARRHARSHVAPAADQHLCAVLDQVAQLRRRPLPSGPAHSRRRRRARTRCSDASAACRPRTLSILSS